MYTTRSLSQLLNSPTDYSANADGPNSGYLVLQDEDQYVSYDCFGLCKRHILTKLPFPQNKELCFQSRSAAALGEVNVNADPVFLIPVLNQPLSLNRYYAIIPHGKHKGKAFTCSMEADKAARGYVTNVEPRPLDPHNIYQQFEIVRSGDYYKVNSLASDGFPPLFTQIEAWRMHSKTPAHFTLGEANGLDHARRAQPPRLQSSTEPVNVGKWYCPFIFVREGKAEDQVDRAMHYEVTLEQRWDRIFTSQKNVVDERFVALDVVLEKEEIFVGGHKAGVMDERNAVDGVIWFTSCGEDGKVMNFGLRVEVLERIRWEQARGGWIGGDEREVKINEVVEFKEGEEWRRLECYVLVERFNFRRMDGSLAMAYDFKHWHKIQTKWD